MAATILSHAFGRSMVRPRPVPGFEGFFSHPDPTQKGYVYLFREEGCLYQWARLDRDGNVVWGNPRTDFSQWKARAVFSRIP